MSHPSFEIWHMCIWFVPSMFMEHILTLFGRLYSYMNHKLLGAMLSLVCGSIPSPIANGLELL